MRYGVGSEVHDSSRRRDAGQLVLRQQDISGYLVVKIWVWVCVDIFLDSLLLEYNGCETHIHMCVYFQVVEFDTFVFPSSAWVTLGAKSAEGNMEAAHFWGKPSLTKWTNFRSKQSLTPPSTKFLFVWDTSMFAGFGTVLLPNISSILKFCNIIGNVPHPSHHPGFSATLPWRQKSNPMPAILELISDKVATGTARLTNLMLHQANTYTLAS